MPLLHKNEWVKNDPWKIVDDAAALPIKTEHTVVSLQKWLELKLRKEITPGGAFLSPIDKTEFLAKHVQSLNLICIEFPVYTDGRGYSHARLLRKRYGYTKELRAIGDIRADQLLFLKRLGFDSVDTEGLPSTDKIMQLESWFEHNYQPSYPLPHGAAA